MSNVRKYTALPTWLLTNLTNLFLSKTHPWRGRWFRLDDWHRRQTAICQNYDVCLWVTSTALVMLVIAWLTQK